MARSIAPPPLIDPERLSRLIRRVPLALFFPPRGAQSDPAAAALLNAVRAADGPKGYLHWDKLRHRPTPAGWTAEDVWTLVHARRRMVGVPLSQLLQKDGTPFTLVESSPYRAGLQRVGHPTELWEVVQELLSLTRPSWAAKGGAAAVGGIDETYRLMAAFDEAHFSSAIEGAVTTRRQSRELLRTQRAPRNRSERMVLNVYHTDELIREHLEEPLTPEFVREVHATVTEGTLEDRSEQGRFREDDSIVIQDGATGDVVFVPPPAAELQDRIKRLCAFANATKEEEEYLHPVTRAILLHHQLAYDHPFTDGNGRTARALFQWAVLRAGFPWFRFLSISRAIQKSRDSYYRSFRYVQTDGGDVTYFVRDQLRCIEAELDRFVKFLRGRVRVARWVQSRHQLESGLNDRQLALLNHALRHPDTEFTVPEHRLFHGVSQPTAYKDIKGLIEEGLLRELRREGRLVIYGATDRLAELARERPPELGSR